MPTISHPAYPLHHGKAPLPLTCMMLVLIEVLRAEATRLKRERDEGTLRGTVVREGNASPNNTESSVDYE